MKLAICLIVALLSHALWGAKADIEAGFEEALQTEISDILKEKKPELICHTGLIGKQFRIVVLDTRIKPETFEEYKIRSEKEDDGIHVQFRSHLCEFVNREIRCPQVDLANIQSRTSRNIDSQESMQSEIFHLHFSGSGARNSMLLYLDTVINEGKRETQGRLLYSPLGGRKISVGLETLTQCPVFPKAWLPPQHR